MDVAAKSEMVEQVRAFVGWVGAGRKLTQNGRITLADARELDWLGLDNSDRFDPAHFDPTEANHRLATQRP